MSRAAPRGGFFFEHACATRAHRCPLLLRVIVGLPLLVCSAVLSAADSPPTPIQLYRSGRYAECVDAATARLVKESGDEALRVLKIKAELELGRYADALQSLDQSLERLPGSIALRWVGRDACRLAGKPERVPKLEEEIAANVRRNTYGYGDATNQMVWARFLLSQAIDPKKVLDAIYNEIKKRQPTFVEAFLASGDLALDKHDYALAAENFEQAIKLEPNDPDAHLGLARAFMPSEAPKAQAALQKALELNPNHVATLLLLVDEQIDAERYDNADELLVRVAGVNPQHPLALAYRAVLALLKNQPDAAKRHREAALRSWATNPEVDYLIGRKLSQEYRFTEGSTYQYKALTIDPKYRPSKVQLAQDLLRLGEEEAGWKLAAEINRDDGYNVVAHNLMTLHDAISKFRTLEDDGFLLRMDAREAEIYGPRVLDLLKRAKRVLCEKYHVALTKPIVVELFPRQQDFAIRTFGLPGGAGFLGVCFGTVITANSPASQGEHPTCWEATLWHEFCHVVTLNKTNNMMPRWLSEGISVYEEDQENPTWGQAINPKYRAMLLDDDLTPVSKLSGAFLNPPSPLHLQFAYFESALVVEYLIEQYGIETLQRILQDLGAGVPINEALARYTGSLEMLDAGFAQFARARAEKMAPDAEWSTPDLPRRADSAAISTWAREHPRNYAGWQRLALQLIAEKQWQAAIEPLEKMRALYPADSGSNNHFVLLARVYRELGDTAKERRVLEELAELSADDVDMFTRLTELTAEAGDWQATRKFAARWLAVNPLRAAPYKSAAAAAEKLGDDPLAITSYEALLRLEPIDPADIHVRLAAVLQRTGDLPGAKRHVLLALEETPRFREGHKRLLEIVAAMEKDAKEKPGGAPRLPAPDKLPAGF